MREPRIQQPDGGRTPFSQATLEDLKEQAFYPGPSAQADDLPGHQLPPDADFRQRYAALLLRERGF